jgi:hypothetical protein
MQVNYDQGGRGRGGPVLEAKDLLPGGSEGI